jgi:hypothetical protein
MSNMKKLLLSILFLLGLSAPSWAIVSSTINSNEYACNSSNKAWNYTFSIILSTDIYVYTIDSSGNLYPQTTNFSVNTNTQTVTYPVTGTACATGYSLLLVRVEPLTQQVAASNQGPSPSPIVMTMSDKLTMISQQLNNNSVQSSPGGGAVTLPPDINGMLLGWNGSVLGNFAPNTGAYLTQATTAQAQAGTNNSAYMTPYLVGQQVGYTGAVSIPFANISGTVTATNLTTTDDTSTNTTYYPTFQTSTGGSNPLKTSSSKLTYNPSTGALGTTVFNGAGTGLTGTASSLTSGATQANANLSGHQFGTWSGVAYGFGSIYQAPTDLIICATVTANSGSIYGATNSSSSLSGAPTVAQTATGGNSSAVGMCFPVKKNDYFEVTSGGPTGGLIYDLPMGS